MQINKSWVAIIEIIIWIFIFSLWLVSIYLIISSSINLNDYNKNQIIATNLAREWLELVKNLRDSNYENLHRWDSLNPNLVTDYTLPVNLIQTWVYYKVSPNFSNVTTSFSVKLDKIVDFGEWPSLITTKMKNYELCLDNSNKYVYNSNCISAWLRKSWFYRYVKFEELKYKNAWWIDVVVNNAYKVTSKVIWYNRWYHDTFLTTIIADYKRL